MQLTNDLGYALVFELARQLPPEEQQKLVRNIQASDCAQAGPKENGMVFKRPASDEQAEFKLEFQCRLTAGKRNVI